MKRNSHLLSLLVILILASCSEGKTIDTSVYSPDNSVKVNFRVKENGVAVYQILKNADVVLEESQLGVVRKDEDFSKGLELKHASASQKVSDKYELKAGKKQLIQYEANKKVFSLENENGSKIDIIFQVSNDGVAFRYYFPETSEDKKYITEEITTFNFPESSKAWMQPCANAKTSWGRCNPSYEENYKMDIPVGTPSPYEAGWVYPALFNNGDNWVIVSESDLMSNYCATRLEQNSPKGEYKVGFPQTPEVSHGGELYPESTLPWYSPWRVLAIGDLKTVTESTLGTDVASPAIDGDFSWVKPGKSSWSWVLLKDGETTFPVQKRFIDYASDMGWQYCLIDAMWDAQIGYDKIKELADYAATKNVGLILWYNSSGDWNDTHQTPKNMMLTHESRMAEFKRIHEMGIKGVKIDFFGGDGQSVIQYYHDILKDAAKEHIAVNFHGCTLPRGWQRTYPHLVSMESVKGLEYTTFEQKDADVVVPHCVMQPFTRNVFDPMDFTPVCFSEIPNIERRTSNGFELALSVLFTSGVQHYAETDEGMTKVPTYVKAAMKQVPSVWDEMRFIDGYPGKYVAIARRHGKDWYIAGINGEVKEKELNLNLSFLANAKRYVIISDGENNRTFSEGKLELDGQNKLKINVKGNGGFLILPLE